MSHDQPSGQPGDQPEYLSSSDPVEPGRGGSGGGRGRRTTLAVGGAVGLAALVGAGAWAWSAYTGVGAQPSEALPADTLAYAAVDLDPSGQQKIEALRTLNKFPAFEDEVGLDTDDDLVEAFFDEALADDDCGLDYAEDFEPWVGQRFAAAAVPGEGDGPTPVLVAQTTDAEATDAALQKISDCEDGTGGWAIRGEWVVITEDDDTAASVADAGEASPLSDDEDFVRWTEAAGDAGVLTAYAAPEVGAALLDAADGLGLPFLLAGPLGAGSPAAYTDDAAEEPSLPPEVRSALEEFEGGALTVRFDDGALELEGAFGGGAEAARAASDRGGEVAGTLPEDTAAAIGFGLSEGWADDLWQRLLGALSSDDQKMLDLLESETGLTLPDDAETLLGESTALALGSDLAPRDLFGGDPGDLPVGLKVRGDTEGIERIVDKLQAAIGPGGDQVLGSDSDDEHVVVGPNADYRERAPRRRRPARQRRLVVRAPRGRPGQLGPLRQLRRRRLARPDRRAGGRHRGRRQPRASGRARPGRLDRGRGPARPAAPDHRLRRPTSIRHNTSVVGRPPDDAGVVS